MLSTSILISCLPYFNFAPCVGTLFNLIGESIIQWSYMDIILTGFPISLKYQKKTLKYKNGLTYVKLKQLVFQEYKEHMKVMDT
jgi:hypothetical protein